MKYIQVEIKLDQVHIEPVTGLLLTMGIDETAVEDPSDLEGILSKEHGYEWDYIDDGVMTSSGAADVYKRQICAVGAFLSLAQI